MIYVYNYIVNIYHKPYLSKKTSYFLQPEASGFAGARPWGHGPMLLVVGPFALVLRSIRMLVPPWDHQGPPHHQGHHQGPKRVTLWCDSVAMLMNLQSYNRHLSSINIYIVFEYSKLLLLPKLLVTTGYLEVQIKLTTLLGNLAVVKHGWSTQHGPPWRRRWCFFKNDSVSTCGYRN